MILGFIKGSLMMGVLFEKYDDKEIVDMNNLFRFLPGGTPEHNLDMRVFMMKDRLNRDYSENDQMIAYFKLNGNNSNKECLKNKFIR